MSRIFYNVEPKVINTELACLIGLNEAIVLQQLHYWIEKNKATGTNQHDGHYWTYGTVQQYRDRDFRFWSFETVKRTLAKLTSAGLVIAGNYNRLKLDQTKWYAINYRAVDELANKNASKAAAVTKPTPPNPDNCPIGQNDLMQQREMNQSNRADCPIPLGQNDLLQKGSMTQSNRADCPNPSEQNDPLHQVNLTHAIPENKKQINNRRLKNKTNTQKPPPPTAAGVCEEQQNTPPHTQTIDGEIVEPSELLFEKFWELYPRKESKHQAQKAWAKLNPDEELFNLIANALEYRSQTKEWLAEGGRYIPHPAKWLESRRWEDETDPQKLNSLFQEKYGEVLIDGKPLDPVQRKQLEYIERQMRAQTEYGEV